MNDLCNSANIRYNYWNTIAVKFEDNFIPTMKASVVIPYYNNFEQLINLLTCLERQTYPHDLFEVIIVDDGSDPPLVLDRHVDLDIKVIRQEDMGYRLALARNIGVEHAKYEIIIFIDCGLLIESNLISSHMRWHHCGNNILTSGQRYHVFDSIMNNNTIRNHDGDLSEFFDTKEYQELHILNYYKYSNNLNTNLDDIFSTVIGANIGISKYYYNMIGGSDISFQQWGGEDNELAYRAYTIGLIIIPVLNSISIHLGLDREYFDNKRQSSVYNMSILVNLIPKERYRNIHDRRTYEISKYVINIEYEEFYEYNIYNTILILLNDNIYDILIVIDAEEHEAKFLKNHFHNEGRVHFNNYYSKNKSIEYSEFTVNIPNNIIIKNNLIYKLKKTIGNNISVRTNLYNNNFISITRTSFVNRSYHTNVFLDELGNIKYIKNKYSFTNQVIFSKLSEMYSIYVNRHEYFLKIKSEIKNIHNVKTLIDTSVFIISRIYKIITKKEAVVVVNKETNILTTNSKYWNYYHNGQVGHLSTCNNTNVGDFLFVIDDSNLYSNITERVYRLKELAMRGILVHIDNKDTQINELAKYINNDLLNLMLDELDEKTLDHNYRELHSIKMRRIAMKDYYVQNIKKSFPLVSILLCTKRTRYLSGILDMLAKQTYPNIEIILGFHGCSEENIDELIKNYPYDIKYIHIDKEITLGAALNQLFFNSSGKLLTKIDDDDLYGEEHIYDLVLAHKYSQATVVGKNLQFIYLNNSNELIQRSIGFGERYHDCIAGGSIMISRESFLFFNGFKNIRYNVDLEFTSRIIELGGNVYATHGYGYVLKRHNIDHTWNISDDYFKDPCEILDASFIDKIVGENAKKYIFE